MTHWTVVSRPGPVEAAILEELAPALRVRRHIGAGVTLRYLDSGPGPAPPVVFLHGRGHGAAAWWPLLGPLASRRRVVAFDLPGFAHSAARPWAGGDARDGLRFFVDPIAAALRELSIERPVLVGHSLGGLVALATTLEATRHGIAPSGLVLVDAMGLAPALATRARLYFRAGPERLARLGGPLRRLGAAATGTRASRNEALRHELLAVRGGRDDASAAFDAMCPMTGPIFHLKGELARVDVPTAIVWGRHDEAFPVEVAVEAARLVPRAELHLLDAGHAPHVERPGEVLRIVTAFVDRLANGSSAGMVRP